jgi:hypothetical protein
MDDSKVQEVLEVSEAIRRAMIANDAEALRRHVAVDYRGSDAGGAVHTRDQMVAAYGPGGVVLELFEVDRVEARGWSDTALVEGVARISGGWQDQTFAHTLRFLDVFARRENRWVLVASQSTDIVAE